MGTAKDSEKTRARIVEAAGQLFAERGASGVTVRDIAQKAETQISALNYHFRGKDALYRDVLLEACRQTALSQEQEAALQAVPAEEALSTLLHEAIKSYQTKSTGWQNALLARESWEAGPVFAEVADTIITPQADFVAELVGEIVGKEASNPQVRFSVVTLFALLDTFGLYGHFVDAMAPGLNDHLGQKERLKKQLFQMVIYTAKREGP